MDRRKFFSLSGASSGLLAVSGLATGSRAQTQARRELPPLKVKLGHQVGINDKALSYAARLGVEWVGADIKSADPARMVASTNELKAARDLVEKHGLHLNWASCGMLNASPGIEQDPHVGIVLGQSPERDREIEAFQEFIRSCAAVGIPTIKYQYSILGVVRTGTVPGRGDAVYGRMNYEDAKKQNLPLTKAGVVSADAYWERIDYFLSRVVPVCNEFKVNISCHPNDPGMYPGYRGVDLVLGSVEGLKKLVAMHESPYHGITFCQGTIAENLDDPNDQIGDVIRYFGSRKKIFVVEFRNIKGRRGDFIAEMFPDEGSVDFVKALKAYREIGYDKALIPDHAPAVFPDDPNARDQNFAFELGYIRGLIQAEQHVV